MYGVIDRFEGNCAIVVLDDGEITKIPMNKIPKESEEGHVLKIDSIIEIDYEKTKDRKNEINELTKDIWDEE